MTWIAYEEWANDLIAIEEKDRKGFIYESLKSKEMVHIFGRYFFHEQIKGSDFPECHIDLIRNLSSNANCAVIMPRGHAKTTWIRIDTIHDIVYRHESLIMFIAPTLTDAKMSFMYIKDQLEGNNLLRDVYGNLVPEISRDMQRKWSDTHFQTKNGVVAIARGAGKGRGINIGGQRPTKIIIDDMEDKEKVQRDYQRKKLRTWLFEVIIPSLDKDVGKFKMVGTVLHYACLLLSVHKKFGGIKRAAIEDENRMPSLQGNPIWWPMEQLEKKKDDIGSFAFAQEFMNDPMSDEDADIKLSWIQWEDSIRLTDDKDVMLYKIYSALDPNISKKQTADEAAICSIAIEKRSDKKINIIVLGCEHGRWGQDGIIQHAKQVYDRYVHERFVVENVGFQEVYRKAMGESGIPARACNPKSKDKRTRLMAISPRIEFGDIKFLRNTCEDLVLQLVQFPNGEHDDMVDAFVYAVQEALDQGSSSGYYGETVE